MSRAELSTLAKFTTIAASQTAGGIVERSGTTSSIDDLLGECSAITIPLPRLVQGSVKALTILLCLVANPVPGTAAVTLLTYCTYFRPDAALAHSIGLATQDFAMHPNETPASFMMRYYNDFNGAPNQGVLSLLEDEGSPTACSLSIATCMLMLICAKQQNGPTARTYMRRRLTAFQRTFHLLCPELGFLDGITDQRFIDEVSQLARSAPKLVATLFDIVRDLSSSSTDAVARPAVTSLSLISFAQMTPLVLALRFALTVPGMEEVSELTVELKRLAAGLSAIELTNEKLEFARLRDLPGAGLLAGKSLPNLSAIGKRIAIQLEGDRWANVKLPTGSSELVIAAGMYIYGMSTTRIVELGEPQSKLTMSSDPHKATDGAHGSIRVNTISVFCCSGCTRRKLCSVWWHLPAYRGNPDLTAVETSLCTRTLLQHGRRHM